MERRSPIHASERRAPGAVPPLASLLAALLVLGGCAAGMPEPAGAPVAAPGPLADSLRRASTPASPRQATFSWELNEAGNRLRGRGVARMEAPNRLRVDLFGPRGETYLAAALVGDSLLLPPNAGAVTLPSPTLLWSAVGVLRPPTGAEPEAAFRSDDGVSVHYRTSSAERITAQAGRTGLAEVRRFRGTAQVESVVLSRTPEGALSRAQYRDWAEFRDLVLSFDAITDAAAFPPAIWRPHGAAR